MKYGILFVLLITLLAASTVQAADPLLEVTSNGKAIQGCQVFHDSQSCLLMQQDGKLVNVPFQSVTDFKVKAPVFRPWSGMELRSQLRKEFGRGYEIKGSERYLIVAPEGKAGPYADLFDQVYREFWSYFSVRQFAIQEPEFPLVAIVFPNQAEFDNYAARDGIRNTQGLAGYYERLTNRVALFDKEGNVAINVDSSLSSFTGLAALDPTLRETIIHEAT
ncbi:MAG: hypothetical protein KDA78_20535, partial [Planctomycetaceae bacterium]|nr:hypothetical protein [Planctomycetaceae bacterium]